MSENDTEIPLVSAISSEIGTLQSPVTTEIMLYSLIVPDIYIESAIKPSEYSHG